MSDARKRTTSATSSERPPRLKGLNAADRASAAVADRPSLGMDVAFLVMLFLTFPYGKFVHGLYRFLAPVRHAREKRMIAGGPPSR